MQSSVAPKFYVYNSFYGGRLTFGQLYFVISGKEKYVSTDNLNKT